MGRGVSLAPVRCNQHPRGCTLAAFARPSHSKIQMRSKDPFPGLVVLQEPWPRGTGRFSAPAASHRGSDGSAALLHPSHPPCPAQELQEAPIGPREVVQSTRILDSPAHDVPAPCRGVPGCISPSFINSAEPKKTHGRDGPSYCHPRPSDTSALAFWAERGRQWREAQSLGQAQFQKARAGLLRLQNFPLPLLTKDPQLAKQQGFGICKEKQFAKKQTWLRYQPCNGSEHLVLISPPYQQ